MPLPFGIPYPITTVPTILAAIRINCTHIIDTQKQHETAIIFYTVENKIFCMSPSVSYGPKRQKELTEDLQREIAVPRKLPEPLKCTDYSGCTAGYMCVEGICEPIPDDPPVLTSAPLLAAGTWPVLPTSASNAFVLKQNYNVFWTFSDDYGSCRGLCTHRARYRKVGDTAWTSLAVNHGF